MLFLRTKPLNFISFVTEKLDTRAYTQWHPWAGPLVITMAVIITVAVITPSLLGVLPQEGRITQYIECLTVRRLANR